MAEFSKLALAARNGDQQAAADLFTLVYDELRWLAEQRLAHEHPGHTLQPTALVHEVYLRLFGVREGEARWEGREQFFSAAAQAMRNILVDSARRKKRIKRGGGRMREPLDAERLAAPELAQELLDLDEALSTLQAIEPRIAELVTLRFFGGMTIKEAAASLGIAPRTADADWAYARAWLLSRMQDGGTDRDKH